MTAPADLRYPTGRFVYDGDGSDARRQERITAIAETPAKLRAALAGLTDAQLDTAYRPGGWTVRQVVHHIPDSHMNAYTRFKLALTESTPTIRPYDEARWSELGDTRAPVESSLAVVDALHRRWVELLGAMSPAQFGRLLFHPERGATMTLDELLAFYAWHGPHHVAHITSLRSRSGWD